MTNKKALFLSSIVKLTLIILSLSTCIHAKCYQYEKGDQFPTFNSSYCTPILKWPVSDEVFATYKQRDAKALAYYTKLYQDYYLQGSVTADCLGMAKYFFCAKSFPTCTDDFNNKIEVVCDWMCDLLSVRCGESNEFFQEICVLSTVTDANCSFGQMVTTVSLFFVLVLFILF